MRLPYLVRLLAVLCVSLMALTSCSASSEPAQEPPGTLADVTLTEGADKIPEIAVEPPFRVASTEKKLIKTGTGTPVELGQMVGMNYVGVNGSTGQVFASSYGKAPFRAPFNSSSTIKGIVDSLTGVPTGSRVMIAVPPADGYGLEGSGASGIGPTDTLIFVIDVISANDTLTRAKGTAVAPKKGLPTVKLASTGEPTISIPSSDPPATLLIQPLIQGAGAEVKAKQVVNMHYVGVIWSSRKVYGSSWRNKAPIQFQSGAGKVIAGIEQAVIGQRVGSQIMVVVPPDYGFGAMGESKVGIKGTDTLVIVVDILDAS